MLMMMMLMMMLMMMMVPDPDRLLSLFQISKVFASQILHTNPCPCACHAAVRTGLASGLSFAVAAWREFLQAIAEPTGRRKTKRSGPVIPIVLYRFDHI